MTRSTLIYYTVFVGLVGIFLASFGFSQSSYASRENIISDGVYNNWNSMSEDQINNFINAFPKSCLKPQNYPANLPWVTWREPLSYFEYSSNDVSAARIVWKAAYLYKINPQVLLATLEKEQGLVSGNGLYGCSYTSYNSAMGYNCPDTLRLSTYPELGITNQTCVEKASNAGFSRQINHAAWQLSFDAHRAYGDLSWMGDGEVYYGGFMTEGTRKRIQGGADRYYDGLANIDGTVIKLANGPTAALYNYTPHFNSFERIFTSWFGPTQMTPIPGCGEATNTTLACVWKVKDNTNNSEMLTSSYDEVWNMVNTKGYQLLEKYFIARNAAAPAAGNVPVYKITMPDNNTLLTIDKNEYDSLVRGGYSGNGVLFYADPPARNSGYAVYRMYSPSGRKHAFINKPSDIGLYKNWGYVFEGEAFTALSPVAQESAPPENQNLVYRFGSMPGNRHFWTADVAERDGMIRAGYHYEGVAWNAVRNPNNTPVYRLYSANMKKHLYTMDTYERDVLDSTSSWEYEGIAFYSNQQSSNAPVYRLYRPQNAQHLYTRDAWERSELIRTGTFQDEGVAWYQP